MSDLLGSNTRIGVVLISLAIGGGACAANTDD
jgi:hypothetical protein